MRYLKLYEEIDFDDFEWEEEDLDVLSNLKEDNVLKVPIHMWDEIKYDLHKLGYKWVGEQENDIKHSSEITEDGRHIIHKPIPHNGLMVMLRGQYPWYKIEFIEKVNRKTNEMVDFDEDDFEWEEEDNENEEIIEVNSKTEQFIKFLRDNDCYDKFIKNYKDVKNIDYHFENNQKNNFISGAFTWMETPEEHNYWSKLNTKWRKLIGHLKII